MLRTSIDLSELWRQRQPNHVLHDRRQTRPAPPFVGGVVEPVLPRAAAQTWVQVGSGIVAFRHWETPSEVFDLKPTRHPGGDF
jgi:hypothetical protein